MKTRWDNAPVGTMQCYLALPEVPSRAPCVVVCMHAPGVDPFIRGMVDRLAQAGFVAIAPDLYHRDPLPQDDGLTKMKRLLDPQILEDLAAAKQHLRALPEADPSRIATIGFCMGGRSAYLHATADPELRAAVVFYGGNIMIPWGEGPSPFDRSIAIQCPVLGLFGEEDKNPSPDDVEKIDAELTRLGKPHEFHSYPGAGHTFLNDTRPSYRPEAAADAWDKCLTMLRRTLT
jgi:carboxymethylenebutenolidase